MKGNGWRAEGVRGRFELTAEYPVADPEAGARIPDQAGTARAGGAAARICNLAGGGR